MPIYEYRCGECNATFEELVRSEREGRRLACPKCGGKQVERLPSVFAAHSAPAQTASGAGGCKGCDAAGSCPMAG